MTRTSRTNRLGSMFVLVSMLLCSPAMARDAAAVKRAIDNAKDRIGVEDFDSAERYLTTAETKLQDVPEPEKSSLGKEVATLRKTVVDARNAYEKGRMTHRIESQIQSAKENLNDPRVIAQCEKVAETLFATEEGKKLFTADEMASYRKQFAAIKAESDQQAMGEKLAEATKLVDELEQELPKIIQRIQKPDNETDRRYAYQEFPDRVTRIDYALKEVGETDAAKALRARVAKMSEQFDSVALADQNSAYVARLSEFWDSQLKECDGWEQETPATTFEAYQAKGLQAGKTETLLARADYWLESRASDTETPDNVKNSAPAKALEERVRQTRAKALAKLEQAAEGIVADVEKLQKPDSYALSAVDRLGKGSFERALLGSEKRRSLEERCLAVVDKFEKQAAAQEAAQKELYAKMTETANAAWPKIASSIAAEEITDPSSLKKGQMVKVTGWENRMGWDYRGSSYDWGVTINGTPVAGVFAPHVQQAVGDICGKVGRDFVTIGGGMDMIGEVIGPGKCEKRIKTEYRDQGGSALGSGERWDPVDCVVIKVIALRGGPIAVGPDGAATVKGAAASIGGAVGAPSGSSGSSSASSASRSAAGAWMWRILTLAIGLTAAATALLKAGYAPVVASAQGQQITARLGNENLSYIGVACAILGVLWLLKGMIVFGLLVSLSILAAGSYASMDLLVARGWMKQDLAERIRPWGTRIGLACATIAVLHLLLGGRLVIL